MEVFWWADSQQLWYLCSIAMTCHYCWFVGMWMISCTRTNKCDVVFNVNLTWLNQMGKNHHNCIFLFSQKEHFKSLLKTYNILNAFLHTHYLTTCLSKLSENTWGFLLFHLFYPCVTNFACVTYIFVRISRIFSRKSSVALVLAAHISQACISCLSADPHLPIGIRHLSKHPYIRALSQTEGCILRRSHLQAAYIINPGLFQLTEHNIHES